MGFFDGLVVPDPEPPTGPPPEVYLPRYERPPEGSGDAYPPEQWFVPARLTQATEAGRGPEARVVLHGWDVWRHSATLKAGVYLRVIRPQAMTFAPPSQRGAGGLRCGLLLADGMRVTTLDGIPWPHSAVSRPTLSLRNGHGGGHHYTLDLHLSHLPPEGELRFVVEWPDQGIPETWTPLDAGAVRAAAGQAVEVWPDLGPPPPPAPTSSGMFALVSGGTMDLMAPAPRPGPPSPPIPLPAGPPLPPRPMPHPYPPAPVPGHAAPPPTASPLPPQPAKAPGGWDDMRGDAFGDAAIVRGILARGADPNHVFPDGQTPLHVAAECGFADVIAELVHYGADVDASHKWEPATPLWQAVRHGRHEAIAALLDAGADAWLPVVGTWSAGALGLRRGLVPLFEGRPGYVPLTDAERAGQAEADARAEAFRGVQAAGLSVAFVAGVTEGEAVRRLGSDPARCPVLDPVSVPGPHGTGVGGFDPHGPDAERFLGVTGVADGCVVIQPMGYRAYEDAVLRALSPGTRAYGIHFSVVRGTSGNLSVDGGPCRHEELGPFCGEDAPELRWRYRIWQWDHEPDMLDGTLLAYASAMAGMRTTDAAAVAGPPRRWVELPRDSPLSA